MRLACSPHVYKLETVHWSAEEYKDAVQDRKDGREYMFGYENVEIK